MEAVENKVLIRKLYGMHVICGACAPNMMFMEDCSWKSQQK
jgi:hypothetical protein